MKVFAELLDASKTRRVIQLRFQTPVGSLDRRLAGAYFSKTRMAWQLQLSLDACAALRVEFGEELEIGPRLWEWAAKERKRERKQAKLGRKLKSVPLDRVPAVAPALAKAMEARPYQAPGARFIAQGRNVILADGTGLGKTTTAIAGVIESGVPGPYLVIAPVTALETTWGRELDLRLPEHRVLVLSAANGVVEQRSHMMDLALRSEGSDRLWVVTNSSALATRIWWECRKCYPVRRWRNNGKPKSAVVDCEHGSTRVVTVAEHDQPAVFSREWGAVIMDESQDVLIRNSGVPTLNRTGARMLKVRADGIRLPLSGTPMRGNPLKLWGTLNWIRPREYGAYWTWVQRLWEVEKSGYGGALEIGKRKPDMEVRLGEMLDGVMLRRTREEVAPHLPPKLYQGTELYPGGPVAVWLEMTPAQARAYEAMARIGVAELEDGALTAIGGLAVLTRLMQFANSYGKMVEPGRTETPEEWNARMVFEPGPPSNKLDWTVQFLTDMGLVGKDREPEGKVIIASRFTKTLIMFQTALTLSGVASRRIDGSIPAKQRILAQDQFNDPHSGIDVIFLQTQTGGVSITLDAADDMIILDETHVPDDQEQLEARNDNRRPEERISQRRYWYLKSLGTVDQAIAEANAVMDRDQHQLLDGRRGVAYVRAVAAKMGAGR